MHRPDALLLFGLWLGLGATLSLAHVDHSPTCKPTQAAMRVAGLLGGSARAVATDGRYVFAGVGLQLAVYDASSPRPLEMIGRLAPLPATPFKIVVRDGVAYVGFDGQAIMRVDVQDPTHPILMDEVPMPGLSDFDLGKGNLFMAAAGKLQAFDTHVPTPLPWLGFLGDPLLIARYVAVDGERVYAAGSVGPSTNPAPTIHILMPNDGTWSVVGRLPMTIRVRGIAAAANRLVALEEGLGLGGILWSWKIDRPDDPPAAGTLTLGRFPMFARIEGTVALVGLSVGLSSIDGGVLLESGQIALVDLTDAHEPKLQAKLDTPDRLLDVLSVAGLAYSAQYGNGLRLLDITNPNVLLDGPGVPTLGAATGIAIADGMAYVIHSYLEKMRRLVVVDLGEPSAPVALSSEAVPGGRVSGRVAVAGDRVSVFTTDAATGASIVTYDRSRPDRLDPIGNVALPAGILDVAMNGNHVFALEGRAIQEFDLSTDPPTTRRYLPYTDPLVSISLRDDRLFVITVCCSAEGTADDTLTVLDVADAGRPVVLGNIRLGANDPNRKSSPVAFVSDRLGVVSTSGRELLTLDLSDLRQLRILGRTALPYAYRALAVTDRHALAYDPFGPQLALVDISDPFSPRFMGLQDPEVQVGDAAVSQGRFVLAAMDAGLVVLEPDGLEFPTPTASATTTDVVPPTPSLTPAPPSPTSTPTPLQTASPEVPPTPTRSRLPGRQVLLPWLTLQRPTATPIPPRP